MGRGYQFRYKHELLRNRISEIPIQRIKVNILFIHLKHWKRDQIDPCIKHFNTRPRMRLNVKVNPDLNLFLIQTIPGDNTSKSSISRSSQVPSRNFDFPPQLNAVKNNYNIGLGWLEGFLFTDRSTIYFPSYLFLHYFQSIYGIIQ